MSPQEEPTTYEELVDIAANLSSENGRNPDYDRALSELIADSRLGGVVGVSLSQRAGFVMDDIRRSQQRQHDEWGLPPLEMV